MNILCTFPGKIGDILWSLATVKEISLQNDRRVDMAIMPQYLDLIPLLNMQSYIRRAFVIPNWKIEHSMWGDQPWEAPWSGCVLEDDVVEYDQKFHLGYRQHPPRGVPLIDFIAQQQGLTLTQPVIPFIEARVSGHQPASVVPRYIAYAFNAEYADLKTYVRDKVRDTFPAIELIDTTQLPWPEAARKLKSESCYCYIGCRSSNHVLANGVGQKNIIIYEPHPNRNGGGGFGSTFTCPYNKEVEFSLNTPPEAVAEQAVDYIRQLVKEKEHVAS